MSTADTRTSNGTPDHGFRAEPVTAVRPGLKPREESGPIAWWEDGTTYVLRTTSDHVRGVTVADEADTVLMAVDAITGGEPLTAEELRAALRDVRRLRTRLDAVSDELVLMAREAGEDGRPRLSWRAIGEETGQHHTTVVERHGRVASGEFAQWRTWLVQHTDRASMYPTTDGAPASVGGRRPAHLPKGKRVHRTEVYDVPGEDGLVFAQCLALGCPWKTEPMSNVVTAALVGSTHEVAPQASGGPDDGPACRESHPDGDTRCVLASGHEDAVARHADVIGRSW